MNTPTSTTPTAAPVVAVKDLTVAYENGRIKAVNGVSFSVPAGQVVGLLGGNGAGKTSTLRVLSGVVPATAGSVQIAGLDLSRRKSAERSRRLVGYCPDTGGLIRQATIREHIGIALALRGRTDQWPHALDLVEKFGLTAALDREALGFSHGMSRRLSVLLAAISAEKVLILDEPFDGVDPLGVDATKSVIDAAKRAGLAVIVSTHLLSLLSEVADRMLVMSKGKILDDSTVAAYRGPVGESKYAQLLRGPGGPA